jgi:hypothetical protein
LANSWSSALSCQIAHRRFVGVGLGAGAEARHLEALDELVDDDRAVVHADAAELRAHEEREAIADERGAADAAVVVAVVVALEADHVAGAAGDEPPREAVEPPAGLPTVVAAMSALPLVQS